MTNYYNVADGLADVAARNPYRPGIIFPAGRDRNGRAKTVQLSFKQLNDEVNAYAHGLAEFGIRQGERVLLLARPGVELITSVFALLRIGAVPVIIDPGMGRQAFLQCVAETEPTVLLGIPVAHIMRRLYPRTFATVKRGVVVTSALWGRFLGDTTLSALRQPEGGPFSAAPTTLESEAAVAFTSGSTGIPKGVVYLHGMFRAQIDLLKNHIGIQEGEVDLALLYVFALFNPALGVTTVLPDMDPTQSAEINPAYVVEAIQTHGVTNAFGSPTIWKRVVPYCVANGIQLPSLKRVLMASAPVPPSLVQTLIDQVLSPEADVNTPFGATEAMPLTWMPGREIVDETRVLSEQGRGMCVGHPLPGITIRVIRITEDPIPTWDDDLVLPPGEIGEIVVSGQVVTRTYLHRPDQTARAKILGADGVIWHRMGDTGYFDEQGRLWFCGRKAHRVEIAAGMPFPNRTMFPVPCETIFNRHPDVARTALVGVGPRGHQRPVLVVEPREGKFPASPTSQKTFADELLALGAQYAHTQPVHDILFYPGAFPVDVRHNVKIQREKLAVWAAAQLEPQSSLLKRLRSLSLLQHDATSYRSKPRFSLSLRNLLSFLSVFLGVAVSVVLLRRMGENGKQ
ncbi:MAG: AMP-binding protein [Anaerolineae bacterium]|nr:AMP-binding protein [Anaerolineae bacterium]